VLYPWATPALSWRRSA